MDAFALGACDMLQLYVPSQFLKSSVYCNFPALYQHNMQGVFRLLLSRDYPRTWWLPKLLNLSDNVGLKSETQQALMLALQHVSQ